MKYHIDKNGNKKLISELDTDHLINIVRLIKRKSIEGILVRYGGGTTAEDIWYDEDHLFGDEALEYMNYSYYVDELRGRGVEW